MVNVSYLRRLYEFDENRVQEFKAASAGFFIKNCVRYMAAPPQKSVLSNVSLKVDI